MLQSSFHVFEYSYSFCLILLPHYTRSDSGIRNHSNNEKTLISAEICEALDGTVAGNVRNVLYWLGPFQIIH